MGTRKCTGSHQCTRVLAPLTGPADCSHSPFFPRLWVPHLSGGRYGCSHFSCAFSAPCSPWICTWVRKPPPPSRSPTCSPEVWVPLVSPQTASPLSRCMLLIVLHRQVPLVWARLRLQWHGASRSIRPCCS